MFSKELENLIQATLEDGILEDYEKAALQKRAQAEGVDLTELEIYINSILQKRQRELAQQENAKQEELDRKKKEDFGKVCPACGRQVSSLTLNCECGYEFKSDRHVSSVQLLSEKITEIQSRYSKDISKKFDDGNDVSNGKGVIGALVVGQSIRQFRQQDQRSYLQKQCNQEIIDAITLFPVPNTKEDIVDFLALAVPNSKKQGGLWGTLVGRIKILSALSAVVFLICVLCGKKDGAMVGGIVVIFIAFYGGLACFQLDQDSIRHNKIAAAWRAKFDQVMMKGRSLRADAEFTRTLDYYENAIKKK